MRDVSIRSTLGFVGYIKHFALQKRAFLVDDHEFKSFTALRNDIHTTIFVGFCDGQNLCRTADIGKILFLRANHAEQLLLVKALVDHLLVARLEDVQRQRRAGKEDQIEGKQRKKRTQQELRFSGTTRRPRLLRLYALA